MFFLFYYLTDGLFFFDDQSKSYQSVKSLYSSGSDDDIAIWVLGAICFVVFLILLIKKYSLKQLFVIVGIGFIFQVLALLLIEVGSIFSTIIVGRNFYLTVAIVIQSLIFVILIYKGIKVSTGPAQST